MTSFNQHGFNFTRPITSRLRPGEIVVDLFAGGGGASEALKQALGRDPDIAINHDEWAVAMHAANHPLTKHMREDVFHADPVAEAHGRKVGWLHASPDCTHFSQAKGGQPRSRATRALSWVVVKWAGRLARRGLAPRIISLENVEQILKWGRLVAKRDKATGRVLKLDGTVAAKGERVPIEQQFLVPDPSRAGRTWDQFVATLRALGYVVEWRKIKACDFGAGTSRTRLFMVARRDGVPCWPEPTHGPGRALPFVSAADCIDWSIACPSIFTRKKPLADATMRRIARGIKKFVLDAAEPFIVPATHQGSDRVNATSEPFPTITAANRGELMVVSPVLTEFANASRGATWQADEPLRTQCAQVKGGHFAMTAATLVQAAHGEGEGETKRRGSGAHDVEHPVGTIHAGGGSFAIAAATLIQSGYGERDGQAPRVPGLDKPLGTLVDGVKHAAVTAILAGVGGRAGDTEPRPVDQPGYTITAKADCAVVTAFIEQAAGGPNSNTSPPRAADEPVSTITQAGSQQRLVTANLVTMRRNAVGSGADEPVGTVTAHTTHHAVVECTLSEEAEAGALRVAAFLVNYYGNGQPLDVKEPVDTITTRDRLALVTVTIRGVPYVIVDIGLRMLTPPELYRAQGFPPGYIFDRTADGRKITNTVAVRMVGNSVSPPPLAAIARANLDPVECIDRLAA